MKNNAATVASLVKQATRKLQSVTDTARLDAEVLMAHSLQRDRSYLYTWPEHTPSEDEQHRFEQLVSFRAQHQPLAYLTGYKEFWSLPFKVTNDTLIPRPDTELLVELALKQLDTLPGPVLDLGTGSGIIAVCIAHERSDVRVDAVDNCAAALDVARHNAATHQVHVQYLQSDWFSNVKHTDYRLIVSNPPYLALNDDHLQHDGLQYEPPTALTAEHNGMAAIATIIEQASRYTADSATVLIEHGHEQGADVRARMEAQGFQQVTTHRDIESRERVTLGHIRK